MIAGAVHRIIINSLYFYVRSAACVYVERASEHHGKLVVVAKENVFAIVKDDVVH